MTDPESNFDKSQPSPQALFSSVVATILLLMALTLTGKSIPAWGQIVNGEHSMWLIVAPVFAVLLAVSGWLYVFIRKMILGITHTLLMCVVALAGFYFGVLPLITHDYPVESLVALFLMAYAVIGIVALVCVAGMVFDLCRAKKGTVGPISTGRKRQ